MISKKLNLMLNNKIFSDIKFKFKDDETIFYGHKVILSVQSVVFNRIFNGPLATENDTVEIFECNATEFLEVLRFCYTDEAELNEFNVYGILSAANYYNIDGLEDECCDFLLNRKNKSNVCEIYNNCFLYQNKLTESCKTFFDDNMVAVMEQTSFFCLTKDALVTLLRRDSLSVDEFDLFKAVFKWNNLHSEDGIIFQYIRFPIMSFYNFRKCCEMLSSPFTEKDMQDVIQFIKTGIKSNNTYFTEKDIQDVIQFKETGNKSDTLRFSTHQREIYVKGNVSFLDNLTTLPNDSFCEETLRFTVSHKIKIMAFWFHPDDCFHTETYKYGLELSTLDGIILFKCEHCYPKFICDEMIALIPNTKYRLITWTNQRECEEFRRLRRISFTNDINSDILFMASPSIAPFVILHEDPDYPRNGTCLSNIEFKIMK